MPRKSEHASQTVLTQAAYKQAANWMRCAVHVSSCSVLHAEACRDACNGAIVMPVIAPLPASRQHRSACVSGVLPLTARQKCSCRHNLLHHNMTAVCTEMVLQNAQEARVHGKTLKSDAYVYNECECPLSVRSLMAQLRTYH